MDSKKGIWMKKIISNLWILWILLFIFLIIVFFVQFSKKVEVLDGVQILNNVQIYDNPESNLSRTVQIYYDCSDKYSYSNIKYDLVTDILWSFVKINGDGSLNYKGCGNVSGLISLAHSKGVRVHLSFQEMPGQANKFINSKEARTRTINSLLAEVKEKGFDGIDNDIETFDGDQEEMTMFIKELFTVFKSNNPKYRVSIAVPAVDNANVYNGQEIRDYVDYLMIMAYFWDDRNPISGPVEPMSQENSSDPSVITSINYWNSQNIPINKILLGIPYYGFVRETYSDQRLSEVKGKVDWVYIDDIPKYNYERHFDNTWKTPWQVWRKGGQWHQLHYEDIESLSYKYELVNSDNLAGIGIWNINYGVNRLDLWQLIKDKFSKVK